ncbi:hypothetical protein SFRURICE_019324, partial [Spodoptera frugiperda]
PNIRMRRPRRKYYAATILINANDKHNIVMNRKTSAADGEREYLGKQIVMKVFLLLLFFVAIVTTTMSHPRMWRSWGK